MSKLISCALSAALVAAFLPPPQAPDNAAMQAKLRTEETNNSKAMWIMHEITDVHGPRLTGSPGLKEADDWVVATMKSWGLQNAHMEGWNFGHSGWANHLIQANALSPFEAPLEVRPLAWSPSTKGAVTAEAVLLTPPGLTAAAGGGRGGNNVAIAQAGTAAPPMPPAAEPAGPPTQAELTAYFNSMKSKVHGAIVFVGKPAAPAENFTPAALRQTDEQWQGRFDGTGGGRGRGGAPGGRGGNTPDPSRLTPDQVDVQVAKFLVDNGTLVRVNDAAEAYGVIRAQDVLGYNEAPQAPAMMMRNEDYGRIGRLLQDGIAVKLRVDIQNEFYPAGKTAYNAIGEIPGTDKKDEVVMLGGHFDSWAGSTGATDNGAGSTVMLEALRLLQSLGVKPRRTIRIALWSGEEQGLFGSLAYVDQHFGSFENPKPEYAKFDGYVNLDDGTGKPRGASVFGPAPDAAFVAKALSGFRDWGFYGATPSTSRAIGGTDSTSFNHAGLPGIGFSQDPFDYNSFTHHTNLDSYERIYEPDIREAAVEAAAAVYALAMSDDMLPRFTKADMPAPAGDEVFPSRLLPASKKSAGPKP